MTLVHISRSSATTSALSSDAELGRRGNAIAWCVQSWRRQGPRLRKGPFQWRMRHVDALRYRDAWITSYLCAQTFGEAGDISGPRGYSRWRLRWTVQDRVRYPGGAAESDRCWAQTRVTTALTCSDRVCSSLLLGVQASKAHRAEKPGDTGAAWTLGLTRRQRPYWRAIDSIV
jgi:hypothetical protein